MLLAALDARRPTGDADLLARQLAHDTATVAACVSEVAQITLGEDDGVEYLPKTTTAEVIRGDRHAGVRIGLDCRIATAADPLAPCAAPVTITP